MSLNFQFKHQILATQLDAPEDFLRRFAKESRRVRPDSLLRWQSGAGISGSVTLKSGSGYTTFVAEANLIRGQTRYFTPDFQTPSGWDLRANYSRERLDVLLKIAEQAGATPIMLAVAHVATHPVRSERVTSVRQQLVRGLGLSALAGSDVAPWDFSLRTGYPLGLDCFLSVQVAWYQTRSFTVVTRPGETTAVRDWEGHVDEEGIELRLDINNKFALFSGRVEWSSSKILESIHVAERHLPDEFKRICGALDRAMGSEES